MEFNTFYSFLVFEVIADPNEFNSQTQITNPNENTLLDPMNHIAQNNNYTINSTSNNISNSENNFLMHHTTNTLFHEEDLGTKLNKQIPNIFL